MPSGRDGLCGNRVMSAHFGHIKRRKRCGCRAFSLAESDNLKRILIKLKIALYPIY